MKISLFILGTILNCAIAMAQYKAPVYTGKVSFDFFLANNIEYILQENLPNFKDSSVYINDLFFMRFNIDSLGNICKIHFSNENEPKNDSKEFSTIPLKMRTQINRKLDSAMSSTNGMWVAAQKNGKACMSKPMLVVFLCTRGVYNGKRMKPQDRGGKIFGGNEEFTVLSYIHQNGYYIE